MKYMLRVFHLSSIKTLLKLSKKVSNKNQKNQLLVIFDMLYCTLIYQAGFYDYIEFEFYNLSNKQRSTYLTRGKNNKIIAKYNNKEYFHLLDDKIAFNEHFKDYVRRNTFDFNNDSIEDFERFTRGKSRIIFKPIFGEGGKGIRIIDLNKQKITSLYRKLKSEKGMYAEDLVVQHHSLNKLYDKSVNTLRIFTFCKGNKAYFLEAILKIGNGGVTDNFCNGGMYTFLNDTGEVITPAIDQNDNVYIIHPISKEKILGFKTPHINEAIDMVKKAALHIPEVGYIGWDVAITESGPVIIEGNSYPGIFQIKASLGNKEGLIPKYEKIMGIKL